MTKNLWSQIKLIKSSSKNPQQPIYLQLIKQIDHLITTGQLAVGTSMPTTRELSQKLKLNRNTIVKVYSELQLKGLIESHVGRGTIVASKNTVSPHFDKSVPWAQLLSDASLRLPTRSFPKSSNEDIWLARMQPSAELLPIAEFGSCVEKFFNQDLNSHGNQNNAASLLYAPTSGVVKLRELVVKELAGMGVACDLDEVIITNGSTQGLDLAIRALVNPGDRVLIEDPSYHGGIQLFKLAGANLLPMPTDDQGPDLSRLPSGSMQGIKTCYLIPNFRNPTATTISLKRRQQIADWANQHGILLIEDDYGHELSFDAPVPPPIKSMANANVVYLNSFSKRLMPGLRLGYMVVPKGILLEKLQTMKWLVDLGSAGLLQHALAEFVERGYYRNHLKKVMPVYRQRRQVMDEALKAQMPSQVSWKLPTGGLFFWIQLPEGFNIEALIHNCREQHLQISGGQAWSATGSDLPGVRLTFCAESAERITRGIEILGRVLKGMLAKDRYPSTTQQENFA